MKLPPVLSLKDFAAHADIPAYLLYKWVWERGMPHYRIGRYHKIYFSVRVARRWIEENIGTYYTCIEDYHETQHENTERTPSRRSSPYRDGVNIYSGVDSRIQQDLSEAEIRRLRVTQ